MNIISHTLVKKTDFVDLQQLVQKQQSEIVSATHFIQEIEKGNLDATLQQALAQNELAASLVSMRDQMKQFADQERQRNWVTEGLARFVEILRSKNESLNVLANSIIQNLVKYMNANQGALYILNDDNATDVFMELSACYAYNRKKHLQQRIELGQGMVGQVMFEKSTLYLTDIPKDFLKITSGLGEALPRNLVVVPLKIDQTIFGVVEIASFQKILPYQIEFVEKLGESIAATIAAAKVSDRTKRLLGETQQQAEEMRAQEEEMRQNMEELSATQEDMHRVLQEMQTKERYMTDLINASKDSILTIDHQYNVINCNSVFTATYPGMEIGAGFNIMRLFTTEEEKQKYRALYDRVFAGEKFEVTSEYTFGNIEAFYMLTYSPLRNEKGEIIAAAIFVTDVTQVTKAKNEAQQQMEEAKAQGEELRQNMEELAATQEEMQRLLNEVQNQQRYYSDVINGTQDSILTIDTSYNVVLVNTATRKIFNANGVPLETGFNIRQLARPGEEKEFIKPYERAFQGETAAAQKNYFGRDYVVTYNPLRDANESIIGVSIFSHDVTGRVAMEAQTKHREVVMERNRNLLTQLTKSPNIQNGNLSVALEEITTALTSAFGITRAAIWLYEPNGPSIVLEKLHQANESKFNAGGQLFKKDIPRYFKSVEEEEIIVAADVLAHASLVEFKKGYLDVLGIHSMLDVPFFLDGNVGGVLCCENQLQAKIWTNEDIDFAKSVADITTIAFKSARMKKMLDATHAKNEEVRAMEQLYQSRIQQLEEQLHKTQLVTQG